MVRREWIVDGDLDLVRRTTVVVVGHDGNLARLTEHRVPKRRTRPFDGARCGHRRISPEENRGDDACRPTKEAQASAPDHAWVTAPWNTAFTTSRRAADPLGSHVVSVSVAVSVGSTTDRSVGATTNGSRSIL